MEIIQPLLVAALIVLVFVFMFRAQIIFLRRKYRRYHLNNYPFSLLVKRETSLQGLDVSIANVSRGGMSIACKENLPLSTIVQFTYQNSLITGVVRYKIPIKGTDPQEYRYGIMYTYFPADLIKSFIKDLITHAKFRTSEK